MRKGGEVENGGKRIGERGGKGERGKERGEEVRRGEDREEKDTGGLGGGIPSGGES